MAILWRLGSGTVEQVRNALPASHRGAYTTVQTVLNRLAGRGLLSRERTGSAITYRPSVTETDYFAGTIEHALAGASEGARHAVLAQLLGGLERGELRELRALAREIDKKRQDKT